MSKAKELMTVILEMSREKQSLHALIHSRAYTIIEHLVKIAIFDTDSRYWAKEIGTTVDFFNGIKQKRKKGKDRVPNRAIYFELLYSDFSDKDDRLFRRFITNLIRDNTEEASAGKALLMSTRNIDITRLRSAIKIAMQHIAELLELSEADKYTVADYVIEWAEEWRNT